VSDAAGEGCPVAAFVDWWVEDEQADRLVTYVTTVAFPGAQLTERCVVNAVSVSAACVFVCAQLFAVALLLVAAAA
jgi:hypothetical protein